MQVLGGGSILTALVLGAIEVFVIEKKFVQQGNARRGK
jgi:hypothetical protein